MSSSHKVKAFLNTPMDCRKMLKDMCISSHQVQFWADISCFCTQEHHASVWPRLTTSIVHSLLLALRLQRNMKNYGADSQQTSDLLCHLSSEFTSPDPMCLAAEASLSIKLWGWANAKTGRCKNEEEKRRGGESGRKGGWRGLSQLLFSTASLW